MLPEVLKSVYGSDENNGAPQQPVAADGNARRLDTPESGGPELASQISPMIDERALNIYTDGSSKSRPRRGGIGVIFVWVDGDGKEVSEPLNLPGYKSATNNEMEINACIVALENAGPFLDKGNFRKIIIFTDSDYVITNYRNAMFLWPRTRWLKKSGAPVLNAQLWKCLIKGIRQTGARVDFQKVKAHSSDIFNRSVDKLAKQSASIPLNKPLAVSTVRRKHSKEMTRLGSVEMIGQRITIRVVEGRYLSIQRLYRYRCEVVSRSSPFFRKVDFICSTEVLREGHTYSVRMNSDAANPRIAKLFHEVAPKSKSPEPEAGSGVRLTSGSPPESIRAGKLTD